MLLKKLEWLPQSVNGLIVQSIPTLYFQAHSVLCTCALKTVSYFHNVRLETGSWPQLLAVGPRPSSGTSVTPAHDVIQFGQTARLGGHHHNLLARRILIVDKKQLE